ncbi:MAG TPA: HD domain-containing protein [Phycisphaerae bacterium]|nr:HD domain-containing protein [Phycisphaerae bacterium]HRY69878.1 HD domain-containing protein [Phycisphaerae bacterium]HSA25395.1 HD domain-containing protein [Phycisphaerae bacterium]
MATTSLVSREPAYPLHSVFTQWAELWSRLGLWISLWDEAGNLVEQVGPADSFWRAMVRHSPVFRERLQNIVRRSRGGNTFDELDTFGGLVIITVPLTYRRRTTGVVLACGLTGEFFDQETLARFCDCHGVDRQVFSRLAAPLPVHGRDQLEVYASILAHHASGCMGASMTQREIDDLSTHLAHTYEELNLLYRFSSGLSVARKPTTHFEELAEELLNSTTIQALTVVLEPSSDAETEPVQVQAGSPPVSTSELVRIYRIVRQRPPNAGRALAISDVANDPDLAWAAPRIGKLAFYRLDMKNRLYGGILAINHRDGSEFDSYEIQLINSLAERSAALLESLRLYDDLERLFSGLLHALVSSIDAKDPYTCGHSQRVAWLSRHIARLCGQSEEKSQRAYLSGLLHDIGKIGISEAVLCKTGRLTPQEYEEMRKHPEIGAHILQGVPHVADTIPGVLHHHERMDGKGYPSGLPAYQIPLLGRIIGLADSFDAITTNRTYRKARPLQIATVEIRRCAGTQFDPELADLFLRQDIPELLSQVTAFGNRSSGSQLNVAIHPNLEDTP